MSVILLNGRVDNWPSTPSLESYLNTSTLIKFLLVCLWKPAAWVCTCCRPEDWERGAAGDSGHWESPGFFVLLYVFCFLLWWIDWTYSQRLLCGFCSSPTCPRKEIPRKLKSQNSVRLPENVSAPFYCPIAVHCVDIWVVSTSWISWLTMTWIAGFMCLHGSRVLFRWGDCPQVGVRLFCNSVSNTWTIKTGVVAYAFYPSTWQAEAERISKLQATGL